MNVNKIYYNQLFSADTVIIAELLNNEWINCRYEWH